MVVGWWVCWWCKAIFISNLSTNYSYGSCEVLLGYQQTSMNLHDCEAIEIESDKEVSIGLESVKKALRKCQETNKRFP